MTWMAGRHGRIVPGFDAAAGVSWPFPPVPYRMDDRPWAPERPIYGRIRYMSSQNTMRKLRLKPYLQRWGASQQA